MQKIRSIFSSFLITSFLFGIFWPLGYSFARQDIYDYREFREKIKIDTRENTDGVQTFETHLQFDSPRTTFTLIFGEYQQNIPPSDLSVDWIIGDEVYSRTLDLEDPGQNIATFPLVTRARDDIILRIRGSSLPNDFELITARHDSTSTKVVFSPGGFAMAASPVVSRKEWGVDETLRYVTVADQARRITEWHERGETPKVIEITPEEKAKSEQSTREMNEILSLDPDATTTVSRKRYEGDNKLIWPIQKTKKVNRIIIHHTAESLDKNADDETLLRAIYAYHARTKGWGDIGYHYVIGQRGKIYEGRAGGDYVEGAHVYGNNYGSVGISVIGNYNDLTLNRDQKAGLIEAVTMVAKKYGIDVRENVTGAYPCGGSDCTWRPVTKNRLAGHRDFGNTSCPGNNLYALIPEIRNTVASRVGNVIPLYNQEKGTIDPVPPEDAINYIVLSGKSNPRTNPIVSSQNIKSSGGKPIKIRLSYPEKDTVDLKTISQKPTRLILDSKRIPTKNGEILSVGKVGNNKITIKIGNKSYTGNTLSVQSELIEISSWDRRPAWDNQGKYNDNLFRTKIVVRNINGKLLLVNELPIEDYLKGLGEVSNSDLPEKIKTIIVGARSYAYYYIDPKNRKYSTSLYDGSDNPDEFQKYLGYSYEMRSPIVAGLVDATRGRVITYQGKLIKSWYFSSSDGKTRSYFEYCQSNGGKSCIDIPYLQSVDDPAGVGHARSGHGVGISGIGATYAASIGKKYDEIIAYYLQGVKIENIKTLK